MVRSAPLNFLPGEMNLAFSGNTEGVRIDRIRRKGTKYFMSGRHLLLVELVQGRLGCRPKNHCRHRRQVRDLFRNVAPLGLNSLIISCAKLCIKANQLDLRAAFFLFFTSDAKSNGKYLLILLFSGLDGRETLFIALLALVQALP